MDSLPCMLKETRDGELRSRSSNLQVHLNPHARIFLLSIIILILEGISSEVLFLINLVPLQDWRPIPDAGDRRQGMIRPDSDGKRCQSMMNWKRYRKRRIRLDGSRATYQNSSLKLRDSARFREVEDFDWEG